MSHGEADEYGIQVGRYIQANKLLDDFKKKHLKSVSNEFQTSVNASHTVTMVIGLS
jgi:predicted choloylglycine hydrolase